MRICEVKKCYSKHQAKGYCIKHYSQLLRHGKILKQTRFDKNKLVDCGNYYEICLYDKQHQEIARTLIDKDDLNKIKGLKFHLDYYKYVTTRLNNREIKLHQLVLGKKKGFVVDHKNTNKLDNRKKNLRFATKSQNGMNRKAKGIDWDKNKQKWLARIKINYKQIHLGSYNFKKEALNARKQAEIKYFKQFKYDDCRLLTSP